MLKIIFASQIEKFHI